MNVSTEAGAPCLGGASLAVIGAPARPRLLCRKKSYNGAPEEISNS